LLAARGLLALPPMVPPLVVVIAGQLSFTQAHSSPARFIAVQAQRGGLFVWAHVSHIARL
jgi:hypothetical protein